MGLAHGHATLPNPQRAKTAALRAPANVFTRDKGGASESRPTACPRTQFGIGRLPEQNWTAVAPRCADHQIRRRPSPLVNRRVANRSGVNGFGDPADPSLAGARQFRAAWRFLPARHSPKAKVRFMAGSLVRSAFGVIDSLDVEQPGRDGHDPQLHSASTTRPMSLRNSAEQASRAHFRLGRFQFSLLRQQSEIFQPECPTGAHGFRRPLPPA